MGHVRRQEESGTPNNGFPNLHFCLSHFASVMRAAAARYKRSELQILKNAAFHHIVRLSTANITPVYFLNLYKKEKRQVQRINKLYFITVLQKAKYHLIQLEAAINLLWHHNYTQGQKRRKTCAMPLIGPYQVSDVSCKWHSFLATIKKPPQPLLVSPVSSNLCASSNYLKERNLLSNKRSVLRVDKEVSCKASVLHSVQMMESPGIWTC